MGDLTPHFSVAEFRSKKGGRTWNEAALERLAWNLEVIRDQAGGLPLKIIDGCREPKNNAIPKSGCTEEFHRCCEAADFTVGDLSNVQAHALVRRLRAEGKIQTGGLGLYPDRFVHYDIRRPDWGGNPNAEWFQCEDGGPYVAKPCAGGPTPLADWRNYPLRGSLDIRDIYPPGRPGPVVPLRFAGWASATGRGTGLSSGPARLVLVSVGLVGLVAGVRYVTQHGAPEWLRRRRW